MGVTIETYRCRIGLFSPSSKRKQKLKSCTTKTKYNLRRHKFERTSCLDIFISCLIWSALFGSFSCYLDPEISLDKQNIGSQRNYSLKSNETESKLYCWTAGLNWSYGETNTNLSHYIYGNRKNVGYKYFSWNCDRGLISKHKIEDVRVFAARHKPHFLSISEVDLKRNENNKNENNTNELSTDQVHDILKVEGYRIILPHSWETHNRERIIVYANDEIKAKMKNSNVDESHLQTILLEVGFGKSKTHLVNFYYREWKSCVTGESNANYQLNCLSKLMDIWRRCTEGDKDFLALGDMNLCALQMDDPSYVHSNLSNVVNDFMIEEGCHQMVDQVTRIRAVGGAVQRSCLDHITVNCLSKMNRYEVHGVGQSDHLGIMVTKYSRELRQTARTTRKRIYKNFNHADFLEDIRKAKRDGLFEEILVTNDIEVAGDKFTKVFKDILDKHAPVKVIQNRKHYVPYISNELKKDMLERDDLKRNAAITGSLEDFNLYKVKRNEVSTKLKSAKVEYFKSKFSDDSLSPGDVFKTASQILGKSQSEFPSQILIGQKLFSTPTTIAEAMNKFFVEKIAKLKDTEPIEDDPLEELRNFLSDKTAPGFTFRELTEEDTGKLIKSLKGKKSCGTDWICGHSLKLVSREILPELTALINITIRTGCYYSKWKYSKVLPGFKNKGSKFDASFYRPLSNLSEVSKLVEKAVHNQVYEYLSINGLIHPDHHGFLRNHSTATALQQLVDTWLRAADNGKLSATILLDLRAGFDVINHDILIQKLVEYGFDDKSVSWFRNYLTGRHQCIQIESSFSEFVSVPWGVPQGSILGPLLFLIFINELPDIVKHSDEHHDAPEEESSIVVFADDNSPTTSHQDPAILQDKIQNEGTLVTDWFSKNDISCSGEKTKLLFLGTRARRKTWIIDQNFSPVVNICGKNVNESTSEKLLGIVVNNTLTWKHQLYGDEENQGLVPALSKRIGMLKKLRKYVPDNKFKNLTSSLFTSKLSYCLNVFGGVWGIPGAEEETTIKTSISKQDMRRLQILQNRTLRLETRSDRNTPTTELLSKTRKLSVHQMVAQSTAVQVYNVNRSQEPRYHHARLFGRNQPTLYETRTARDPRLEVNLSLGRGGFFYQGSRIWTALPQHIKDARNVETFKKNCKKWVQANILVKP